MGLLLRDKIAIVTGAGRGIGRAISETFASEGATVYAADINGEDLAWTGSFESDAGKVFPVVLDICDFRSVRETIMSIKREQGRVDVLVNNAGLISYELLSFIDFDRLRKMFEVNVLALIHLMQIVSRLMMRQNGGSIINMASMVGLKGAAGQLSYSATKGAVISATLSASKELASSKSRVNAIAPAMVGTDRFRAVLEEKFKERINDIPFGRLADPEDIANACLFLASDLSSYMTGQILGLDGGAII